MTADAQNAKYRRQMASRPGPVDARVPPREQVRIKRRCNRCGRARAVYREFGTCRTCFRNLAGDGLIPGVTKASW